MLYYQTSILLLLCATAFLVWRNLRDYQAPQGSRPAGPRVSVLVPARNEAENIEACLAGLLAQSYRDLEIVVLDDGSTDDTAERVRRLAAEDPRVSLIHGTGLPPGWAGKAHACWEASRHARGEWLLFVDADTRHGPELVARAVHHTLETGCDLLSTFPRQETRTLGEAVTAPFIFWVLFTLLPLRKVASDPSPSFSAACGQFLFVRREAYEETGGHSAIPTSLHDGLHLARLFKGKGKQVRLADLSDQIHCRMYAGFRQSWSGFTRNAYQGIGSFPVLVFLGLWFGLLALAPYGWLAAGLLSGAPRWTWLAGAQVAVLLGIQVALRSRFHYPWATVALHPVGIALLIAIQWASWWKTVTRARTVWKERAVPQSEVSPEPAPRPKRKTSMRLWTGLLVLLLTLAAPAAESVLFPTFKGKDLTGASVSTESFRGKPWMVTVGFDRAHAKAIADWSAAFKEAFPDESRADLYAVVALDGTLKLFRDRIDKAMSKDKPPHVRKRIMTVYAADSVCRQLGIKDRKQVHVYILDPSGRIVHHETGEAVPEAVKRVREAVDVGVGR